MWTQLGLDQHRVGSRAVCNGDDLQVFIWLRPTPCYSIHPTSYSNCTSYADWLLCLFEWFNGRDFNNIHWAQKETYHFLVRSSYIKIININMQWRWLFELSVFYTWFKVSFYTNVKHYWWQYRWIPKFRSGGPGGNNAINIYSWWCCAKFGIVRFIMRTILIPLINVPKECAINMLPLDDPLSQQTHEYKKHWMLCLFINCTRTEGANLELEQLQWGQF